MITPAGDHTPNCNLKEIIFPGLSPHFLDKQARCNLIPAQLSSNPVEAHAGLKNTLVSVFIGVRPLNSHS